MIVTAMQGDTVDLLCYRHLGGTAIVTEQVLDQNPGLAEFGAVLPIGTQVMLPDTLPDRNNNQLIQLWD